MDLTRITRKPVYIDLGALLEGADPGVIASADVALIPTRTDPDASTVWTNVTYVNPTANFVIAGPDAGGGGALVAAGTCDLWVRATAPTWVDASLVERINVLDGGPLEAFDPSTLPDAVVAGLVTGVTATRDALRAAFVAGAVYNNNGTPNTAKRLHVKLTADGLDIDDLIIEDA